MKNKFSLIFTLLALIYLPFTSEAREHTGPPYSRKTYESFEIFVKNFAKKKNLTLLSEGLGNGKRSLWGAHFLSKEQMSLDESRKLAAEITFQLLYKIFHDPLFANYCKITAAEYSQYPNWVGSDRACPDLKSEYVSFRLAFWDKNMDRPLHPYIAEVRLESGLLYFHYADPVTQALQEPIIESIETLNLKCFH